MFSLLIFTLKCLIVVVLLLVLLAGITAILGKAKEKMNSRITIKHLNQRYEETAALLKDTMLSKAELKTEHQKKKKTKKIAKKSPQIAKKRIFLLQFHGDIKASAVANLREEITAILTTATTTDEVVVKLESAGGMVHAYGLAAAQLLRIRDRNIPLTVIIDKVAASGGYLMACVAHQILAAPFAIIGSIGVIVQLPNFNRFLKEKHIDFEQLTAGNYKRTLTLFGENSEAGREKMREEIAEIHQHFKNLISRYRQQINIDQVATGEHWLGTQALALQLVDGITTSDDYLLRSSETHDIYEIAYLTKKSWGERLKGAAANLVQTNFAI